MSHLGKRLVSSGVIISIALAMIFLVPQWIFFLFIEVFALIAFSEYLALTRLKDSPDRKKWALFFGALVPVGMMSGTTSLVLTAAVITLFILDLKPPLQSQALSSMSLTMFGMIYVVWFSTHIILTRSLEHGPAWVFYTVLIVKSGDAGAYFVGSKLGKHKLIEHISPKKTWEGAIGGFVTTLLASLLSSWYLPEAGLGHLFVIGAAVGVLAQIGDLGESLIKRGAGIKDSGQVPGLGGLLDVLDSLIPTIPFVYYYLQLFVL